LLAANRRIAGRDGLRALFGHDEQRDDVEDDRNAGEQ
jgi:hypothetical protein